MSNPSTPSVEQLKRAIELAEQIDRLQNELETLLGGGNRTQSQNRTASAPKSASTKSRGGRRSVSPEARERIAAAQRARWARLRGDSSADTAGKTQSKPAARAKSGGRGAQKGRRSVSAEGRAKMAEAARKRWAAKKAA